MNVSGDQVQPPGARSREWGHTFRRGRRCEEEKRNQGRHECEVFGSGPEAAESESMWRACKKNPGHTGFIPAPEFSLRHLPAESRDEALLEYIRNIAARTVRLQVGYTSMARPADGYCFSEHRGKSVPHSGSACVRSVDPREGPCRCRPCGLGSTAPPREGDWREVIVQTALHVVYDSEEARHTRVDVFYDDRESARRRTLWGVEVIERDLEGDLCFLLCATHDVALAEELDGYLWRAARLLNSREITTASSRGHDLCVIVSHPHGEPKQVTAGRRKAWRSWRRRRRRRGTRPPLKFVYDTATCPGSSGAPVLVLGPDVMVSKGGWADEMMWSPPHGKKLPTFFRRWGRSWLNRSGATMATRTRS